VNTSTSRYREWQSGRCPYGIKVLICAGRPGWPDPGCGRAGRGRLLAGDQGTAAQRHGAGDDHRQCQRLAGEGGRIGADVLAEQEHAEHAGRQRVQD
jgi:hypothetical protein